MDNNNQYCIDKNEIGREGASALIKSLKNVRNLKSLNLSIYIYIYNY